MVYDTIRDWAMRWDQMRLKKATKVKGTTLIEFVIEQHDMVYPIVPTGADLNKMISRPVHDQFQNSGM